MFRIGLLLSCLSLQPVVDSEHHTHVHSIHNCIYEPDRVQAIFLYFIFFLLYFLYLFFRSIYLQTIMIFWYVRWYLFTSIYIFYSVFTVDKPIKSNQTYQIINLSNQSIYKYIYVTANLRNQIFPGIPKMHRDSLESLK